MRIGPLHVTWLTPRRAELIRIEIRDELRDIATRNAIARLARGEVKNYLAELAEGAEMPFPSAAGFLRGLREVIEQTTTTGSAEYDETADPADDYPFSVTDETHIVRGEQ